ncbi:MAG: hypothetical protein EXR99_08870 [Gemmataceae bacterium]|nr:hypothetical protein [Gemmataceae bacterium]
MDEARIIEDLIKLKAGYTVALGGGLEICQLDPGLFSVTFPDSADLDATVKEKRFKDGGKAAEFFVQKRHAYKLGDDYLEGDLP